MLYINIVTETLTKGYPAALGAILPLVSISFGILVITSKNPIVSVLHLIVLFSTVSLYLMYIGLYFMGLSYILVYVGAISILFLFILMLINVRVSELITENRNSLTLAVISIIFVSISIESIMPNMTSILDTFQKGLTFFRQKLNNVFSLVESDVHSVLSEYPGSVSSKVWDGNLVENSHITGIGNILYTNYSIQIIMIGFILLLAMVGAIVITVKKDSM